MTEPTAEDVVASRKRAFKVTTAEAKERSAEVRLRALDLRASFYEKLIALDAGSIAVAVSVGVALVNRAESSIRAVHPQLSWLLCIAISLALSLACSLAHNSLHVRIAGLEAGRAEDWAKYMALLDVLMLGPKNEGTEALWKDFTNNFHQRVMKAAFNLHHTEQSEYRCVVLGKIAIWTFLFAYLVALIGLVHLWYFTR